MPDLAGRGRALLTYGTAGAAGTFARWLDQDDTAGAELQVPGADPQLPGSIWRWWPGYLR